MRELRSGSAGDTILEVFEIGQGGTGATTDVQALDNLGGLHQDDVNQPGMLIQFDEQGQVPVHMLKNVTDNSVSLSGPDVTRKGSDHDWTITNFDSLSKYTVSVNYGHVTLTGDNIHLYLPTTEQMISPLKLNVARNANTRFLELPIIDGRNTYYQTSKQTTSDYVAVNTSFTTSVETQLDGQNVNTTYSGTRVTYLAGTHNTVHNTTYNTQHGTTVLTNFQTSWGTTSSANQNTYWNTTVPGEYRNTSSGSWRQVGRNTYGEVYAGNKQTFYSGYGNLYTFLGSHIRFSNLPKLSHSYGTGPSSINVLITNVIGGATVVEAPTINGVSPTYASLQSSQYINQLIVSYDSLGIYYGDPNQSSNDLYNYGYGVNVGSTYTSWNTYVSSSWQTLGDPTQRQTSMLTAVDVTTQTSQNTSRNTIAATVYQTNHNTDRETANAESTIQTTFKTSAMTMVPQSSRQTTFLTTQDTAFGEASQYTQYLTSYQTTLNGQLVNTSHLTERQTQYPGGIRQTSWSVSKNTIINSYPVGTEWNTSRNTIVSGPSQNTSFTTTHQTYVTGGTGQTSVQTTKQTIQPGTGANVQTVWNTDKVTTST